MRAVLYIARHDRSPCTADQIAKGLAAPQNYMSKTLHELGRRGILTGTRGPTGGFRLAIPADELTIGAIVDCFDSPRPSPVCLLGGRPCNPKEPCAVHSRWAALSAAARTPLHCTTIAELLGGNGSPAVDAAAGLAGASLSELTSELRDTVDVE